MSNSSVSVSQVSKKLNGQGGQLRCAEHAVMASFSNTDYVRSLIYSLYLAHAQRPSYSMSLSLLPTSY